MWYFASIIFVLWAALYVHSGLLTLVGIAVQACAATWYTLSYIPGGRTVVSAALSACNPFG